MQIMAASSRQAAGLLLLLFVVAVPTASAQGRSKIRIVECINESIGNISLNLDRLHAIVIPPLTTTTTLGPTTTQDKTTTQISTTTKISTTTQESSAIFRRLQSLDLEPNEGSWVKLDEVGFAVPELFRGENLTLDCRNNPNCEKVLSALDEADAITAEVDGDMIIESQVYRIYQADADVVKVVFEAPEDLQLLAILRSNIADLESRMETLKADKAAMQDLQDKMKTKEKLAIVFGLIAGVLVFIGLTAAGYSCYQKTRKDPGVPEGLIIE